MRNAISVECDTSERFEEALNLLQMTNPTSIKHIGPFEARATYENELRASEVMEMLPSEYDFTQTDPQITSSSEPPPSKSTYVTFEDPVSARKRKFQPNAGADDKDTIKRYKPNLENSVPSESPSIFEEAESLNEGMNINIDEYRKDFPLIISIADKLEVTQEFLHRFFEFIRSQGVINEYAWENDRFIVPLLYRCDDTHIMKFIIETSERFARAKSEKLTLVRETKVIYDYPMAFKHPYCNSKSGYDVLKNLDEHIDASFMRYDKDTGNKILGPCFPMIQSSGYGKSRLGVQLETIPAVGNTPSPSPSDRRQLSSESETKALSPSKPTSPDPFEPKYEVVYMCFRDDNESGYPVRSNSITNLIKSFDRMVENSQGALSHSLCWSFLMSAIPKAISIIPWESRKVADLIIEEGPSNKGFWLEVEKWFNMFVKVHLSGKALVSSSYVPTPEFRALLDLPEILKKIVVLMDEAHLLAANNARNLNSARRGLRFAYNIAAMMGIFIDTNSSVSNFLPADVRMAMTDSTRPQGNINTELLPPFCGIPMELDLQNQTRDSYVIAYNVTSANTISVKVWHYLIGLQSRAMFAVMFEGQQRGGGTMVTDIVIPKLLRAPSFDELLSSSLITSHSKIVALFAIFGCRWPIGSVVGFDANTLVKQHLATCLGVNQGGNNDVEMAYPSEPILAEAAMCLMNTPKNRVAVVKAVLNFYSRQALVTNDGKGDAGEMLAAYVFGIAYDRVVEGVLSREDMTKRGRQRTLPVPLVDVLSTLYKKQSADLVRLLGNFPKLQTAIVCYSHFAKVEVDVTKEILQQYLRRGCAICCKDREFGMDLIIPIALKKDGSGHDTIDITNPATYDVSAWLIQVKNRKQGLNIPKLTYKMFKSRLAQSLLGAAGTQNAYLEVVFTTVNVQAYAATNKAKVCEEISLKAIIDIDLRDRLSDKACTAKQKKELKKAIDQNQLVDQRVFVTQSSGLGDGVPNLSFLDSDEMSLLRKMREAPRFSAVDQYYTQTRNKSAAETEQLKRQLLPSYYGTFDGTL